jgi:cell division protein FtsI/penicillin-binding protein 2
MSVDVTFFTHQTASTENNISWRAEIYSARNNKLLTESTTLKNENIAFVDARSVEGATFIKDLVDNDVVSIGDGGNAPPISVMEKQKLDCSNEAVNCVDEDTDNADKAVSQKQKSLIKDLYKKAVGREIRSQIATLNNRTHFSSLFLLQESDTKILPLQSQLRVKSYGCNNAYTCTEVPLLHKPITIYLRQKLSGVQYNRHLSPSLAYLKRIPAFIRYELPPTPNETTVCVAGENVKSHYKTRGLAKELFEITVPAHPLKTANIDVVPQNCLTSICPAYRYENQLELSVDSAGNTSWYPRTLGFPLRFPSQEKITSGKDTEKSHCKPIYAEDKNSDRIALFAKQGNNFTITDIAENDLGLFNLIGGDDSWLYHLGHATRDSLSPITLSIKPEVQKIAVQLVQKTLNNRIKQDPTFKNNISNGAKVTLVALNAKSGEIIAAYSKSGLTNSDRHDARDSSIDITLPDTSKHRWSPVFHNKKANEWPGSTFKLFSALSFFQHVNEKRPFSMEIASILQGAEIRKFKKLKDGTLRPHANGDFYYAKEITPGKWINLSEQQQFDFSPLSNRYPATLAQHQVTTDGRFEGNKSVGLAEALQKSHNCWFSWMIERTSPVVQYLGNKKSNNYGLFNLDTDESSYENGLIPVKSTVAQLGFDKCINLLDPSQNSSCSNSSTDVYKSWILRPILFTDLPDVHQLRRLAFGYNVTLAPLHLATLSAMISQNEIITPTLIKNKQHGKRNGLLDDENQINTIRKGMKLAVTQGTVRHQFGPSYEGRVWAKTGTTKSKSIHYRNLWLTGYFCENPSSSNSAECGKQYSFACNVSMAGSLGKNTGAKACGPLVREFISQGDKLGVWQ